MPSAAVACPDAEQSTELVFAETLLVEAEDYQRVVQIEAWREFHFLREHWKPNSRER